MSDFSCIAPTNWEQQNMYRILFLSFKLSLLLLELRHCNSFLLPGGPESCQVVKETASRRWRLEALGQDRLHPLYLTPQYSFTSIKLWSYIYLYFLLQEQTGQAAAHWIKHLELCNQFIKQLVCISFAFENHVKNVM